MGTSFQEIYDLSKVSKSDSRLINKPINLVQRQLYNSLIFSISEFLADCYKDLSDRVDFEEKEYTFQGNMGNSTFNLDTPPSNFTDIYVNIEDDTVSYNYSFDDTTNILTITPLLSKDCEVYVSIFRRGYFNITLNDVEKVILAEGLNVVFLEEMRNKDSLLNQLVYGSDFKIFSQGQHIDSLNSAIKMQYEMVVRPKINDYSYKFSPNRLTGMSGNPNYIPSGGAYKW